MELWDIYNAHGERTGRTVSREAWSPASGEYHLAASAIIVNSAGEILCSHRAPEKRHRPDMWEVCVGSAQAGEDSLRAIRRELREELGLDIPPEDLTFFYRAWDGDCIRDTFLCRRELDPASLILQPEETDCAAWFPFASWERMARAGEILIPATPDDEAFYAALREEIRMR